MSKKHKQNLFNWGDTKHLFGLPEPTESTEPSLAALAKQSTTPSTSTSTPFTALADYYTNRKPEPPVEIKIPPPVRCHEAKNYLGKVIIPIEILDEIYGALVNEPIEWAILLHGEKAHNGLQITVDNWSVPKQTRSHGDVDIDEFIHTADIVGVLHSHHSMGTFFSSVDKTQLNPKFGLSIVISTRPPREYSFDTHKDSCERFGFFYLAEGKHILHPEVCNLRGESFYEIVLPTDDPEDLLPRRFGPLPTDDLDDSTDEEDIDPSGCGKLEGPLVTHDEQYTFRQTACGWTVDFKPVPLCSPAMGIVEDLPKQKINAPESFKMLTTSYQGGTMNSPSQVVGVGSKKELDILPTSELLASCFKSFGLYNYPDLSFFESSEHLRNHILATMYGIIQRSNTSMGMHVFTALYTFNLLVQTYFNDDGWMLEPNDIIRTPLPVWLQDFTDIINETKINPEGVANNEDSNPS